MASDVLGAIGSLICAAVWGAADFVGGVASRGRSQLQVLVLVSLSGLLFLGVATLVCGESWPDPASVYWSAGAGISGAVSIVGLYRGLAISEAALVAPAAAVIGVVLPVLVGFAVGGPLAAAKWLGMAAGVLGIWLVSSQSRQERRQGLAGLGHAALGGLGFGGFFVLIAQVREGSVFAPLVVAKAVAAALALLLLGLRGMRFPSPSENGWALLAGLLDAGGNVFYLLASHLTRIELAAVISSMAPAVTVFLAWLILRQRIETGQKLGVGFCLLGIALIVS